MKNLIYQLEQSKTTFFQFSVNHIQIDLNQSIPASVFKCIIDLKCDEVYCYNGKLMVYLVANTSI